MVRPYLIRVKGAAQERSTIFSIDDSATVQPDSLATVPESELEILASQRLGLLMDSAASIQQTEDVAAMADAAEFITLWTVIFDLEKNKALCVDSGHGYCLIVKQDGTIHQVEIEEGGPPIGVVSDYPYVGVEVDFNPGDRMVIFSDGLVEQQGPDGNMFEFERVFKALEGSPSEQEDVKRLYAALEAFSGGRSWQDDVTIMSVCHDS